MRCAMAARRPSPTLPDLAELIMNAPQRVAVTTFASNVARIRAVADAARAADREVVVVGRAMERVAQVARETGYLDGLAGFPRHGGLRPSAAGQGGRALHRQPGRAARRARAIAETIIRGHSVEGRPGIFLSRTIPGNEKAIGSVINGLINQGVEVITDRTHLVHVSAIRGAASSRT